MNDQDRIAQLERDNSQLKEALQYFVKRSVFGGSIDKAIVNMRESAEESFRVADMLEQIAPLLK